MQDLQDISFYILSDTHDLTLSHPDHSLRTPADSKIDVVLHCGDITENGTPEGYKRAIELLGTIDAELKLVIAGNHDVDLDRAFYLSEGGFVADHSAAIALLTSTETRAKGIRYLTEGTHRFTLQNGRTFSVYTSPYTPQYGVSAFQYPSGEDRYNPPETTPVWARNVATPTSTIPEGVDIVMTHGPPKYILDRSGDGGSAGCEHLRRAICRVRPRLHCFGHIHAGYGAQRVQWSEDEMKEETEDEDEDDTDNMVTLPVEFVGKNQAKRKGYAMMNPGSREAFASDEQQTLMVNAAIMDTQSRPTNFPWMVQLRLSGGKNKLAVKSEKRERDEEEDEETEQVVTKKRSQHQCTSSLILNYTYRE